MSFTNPSASGVFLWLVPETSGSGLVPAAGYTVTFYSAGTTNPLAVYTDPELKVPYPSPSNVVTLNSQGYAIIYLGNFAYKRVIASPEGQVVSVLDNFVGGNQFGSGFCANIAELRTLNTTVNQYTYVTGYYQKDDGGGGFFYAKSSTQADDGGYAIQSSFDPSIVWFRIQDEDGSVRAASFGYIPSNSGDQTSALLAADAYAATLYSAVLRIQSGNVATISGTITLKSPVVLYEPGAQLNGATPSTVTHNGIVVAAANGSDQTSVGPGVFHIFSTNITAVLSANQIDAVAEWWGATLATPDNKPYFDALWASGAGGFRINPGVWTVSSSTPPTNKKIVSYGELTDGVNVIVPTAGEYYFSANHISVVNDLEVGGTIASAGKITGGDGLEITGLIQGDSLTTSADASIGGTVTVSGNIIGNGILTISGGNLNVNSGGVISSGSVFSGGSVVAKAGSGSQFFKTSGRILIATSGTLTLPANTITATNDSLKVVAQGTISGSPSLVTFIVAIGTATITLGGNNNTVSKYRIEVDFFKTAAANTFYIVGALWIDSQVVNSSNNIFNSAVSTDTVSDFSAPQTIQVSSSATITQTAMFVDFYPAV